LKSYLSAQLRWHAPISPCGGGPRHTERATPRATRGEERGNDASASKARHQGEASRAHPPPRAVDPTPARPTPRLDPGQPLVSTPRVPRGPPTPPGSRSDAPREREPAGTRPLGLRRGEPHDGVERHGPLARPLGPGVRPGEAGLRPLGILVGCLESPHPPKGGAGGAEETSPAGVTRTFEASPRPPPPRAPPSDSPETSPRLFEAPSTRPRLEGRGVLTGTSRGVRRGPWRLGSPRLAPRGRAHFARTSPLVLEPSNDPLQRGGLPVRNSPPWAHRCIRG
jgi:hypothetical protein